MKIYLIIITMGRALGWGSTITIPFQNNIMHPSTQGLYIYVVQEYIRCSKLALLC